MTDESMTPVERLDNLIDFLQGYYENQLMTTLQGIKPVGLKDTSLIYVRMRTLWDLMAAISKLNGENYNRIEAKIGEIMVEQDLTSYTLAGLGRIGTKTQLFASVVPEMKQEAFQWLRDSGNAPVITETVNYQSLSAFIRAEVEQNRDVPETLFKTFLKTSVSFTKTK